MSMVTVHGPNTMYTTQGTPAGSTPPGARATVSPTNGLVWNFSFPQPGARPATDFDWTFTGPGSPAAQNDRYSGTVTFTGPGAATIVCTVAAGAGPPAAGTYTISVTATAGQPRALEGGGEIPVTAPADGVITDVQVEPSDRVQEGDVVATESPGATANNGVEEYDPYDHTVAEVMEEAHAATDDPAYIREILEAEQAGKNRSTLVTQLQDLLDTLG